MSAINANWYEWSRGGSPAHRLLRRARLDAEQVEQGLKSNPIGVPGFLLGGAALSGAFSAVAGAIRSAVDSEVGRLVLGIVLALTMLGLSWVAIYAASIARRRIRLTTDQPIAALWDTIGAAGDPPRDQSYLFAVIAIVLMLLAVFAIPLIVWALVP